MGKDSCPSPVVFWEGLFSSKQSHLYGENICLVESWKDENMQDAQQRRHSIYKGPYLRGEE